MKESVRSNSLTTQDKARDHADSSPAVGLEKCGIIGLGHHKSLPADVEYAQPTSERTNSIN